MIIVVCELRILVAEEDGDAAKEKCGSFQPNGSDMNECTVCSYESCT